MIADSSKQVDDPHRVHPEETDENRPLKIKEHQNGPEETKNPKDGSKNNKSARGQILDSSTYLQKNEGLLEDGTGLSSMDSTKKPQRSKTTETPASVEIMVEQKQLDREMEL